MSLFDWEKKLEEFYSVADEFQASLNFLVNQESAFSNNPELELEREQLIERGNTIRGLIDKATGAISAGQEIIVSMKQAVGFDAVPVLLVGAVAVITASVAGITYWQGDFNRLRDKMYTNMIDNGVPPDEAARLIAGVKPKDNSIVAMIKPLAPLAFAALAAWIWSNVREK